MSLCQHGGMRGDGLFSHRPATVGGGAAFPLWRAPAYRYVLPNLFISIFLALFNDQAQTDHWTVLPS